MSAEIYHDYSTEEWYAECPECGWQSEFYGSEYAAQMEAEDHDMMNDEEHTRTAREKYQARLDELAETVRRGQ